MRTQPVCTPSTRAPAAASLVTKVAPAKPQAHNPITAMIKPQLVHSAQRKVNTKAVQQPARPRTHSEQDSTTKAVESWSWNGQLISLRCGHLHQVPCPPTSRAETPIRRLGGLRRLLPKEEAVPWMIISNRTILSLILLSAEIMLVKHISGNRLVVIRVTRQSMLLVRITLLRILLHFRRRIGLSIVWRFTNGNTRGVLLGWL